MATRPFVPDHLEIAATVARLEARFDAMDDPGARELMAAYRSVSERFGSDLSDARDLLLSQGAALMLVQALLARKATRKP